MRALKQKRKSKFIVVMALLLSYKIREEITQVDSESEVLHEAVWKKILDADRWDEQSMIDYSVLLKQRVVYKCLQYISQKDCFVNLLAILKNLITSDTSSISETCRSHVKACWELIDTSDQMLNFIENDIALAWLHASESTSSLLEYFDDSEMTNMDCSVIGMGFLGTRIAGELSRHGIKLKVFDIYPQQIEKAMKMLENDNKELLKRGLPPPNTTNISVAENLVDAVQTSRIIFEAVPDNLMIKQSIFQKMTNTSKSDTIICSNSINLNLDEISEDALFKERIVGCRFLVPVYSVPLVEISLSTFTSEDVKQSVEKFFCGIGYSVIYKRHGLLPRKLAPEEIDKFWDEQRKKSSRSNRIMQESSDDAHKDYKPAFTNDTWGHGQLLTHQSAHSTGSHFTPVSYPVQATSLSAPLTSNEGALKIITSEHNEQSSAGHVTMIQRNEQDNVNNFKECVVCQDQTIDTIIFPCSHMWLCHACALLLQREGKACPACRGPIANIIRAYTP